MTNYIAIAAGQLDTDSSVTQPLMEALNGNPKAMAEGDPTAPPVAAGWVPLGKLINNDANAGLLYDFGVSGAVANVVSADFADGWEYGFKFEGLSHNSGAGQNLVFEAYRETTAAYNAVNSTNTVGAAQLVSGWAEYGRPRDTSYGIVIRCALFSSAGALLSNDLNINYTVAQKILRARFSFSGGNIDAGKIWTYRRRAL